MDAAGAGRFPTQQIPMLLFPPPPPPPLAAYSSSSYSSATSHHLSTTSLPILVLTVLGILTTSVLLLTYYVFVIRCCLNWHSSSDTLGLIPRRRGRASSSLPVAAVRGAPSEARGLEESAIQALPAFRYRKAIKSTVDSSECAVCLSEFQEEERVRLLPSCLHVFHVDCIDTWLQGNANCPLCRAAITTTTTSCHCQLPLIDQLLRPEEVVIQVVAGTEEEGTQTQQQQEVADSAGDQHVSSKKRKNIKPWHDVTSKGDECIEVKRDRDVLPMRRSFSMDSVGRGEVRLQVQKILQNNTHVHGDHSDSSSSSSTL